MNLVKLITVYLEFTTSSSVNTYFLVDTGDFAIYLKSGATKWKAILLNLTAACSAFIGLYIGISVSHDEEARQWLMAVIAGMFLYIALVDVVSKENDTN